MSPSSTPLIGTPDDEQVLADIEANHVELAGDAPPLRPQIGGTHYQSMPIDVFEYAMANGLDAIQFSVIKYVSRFKHKDGARDLQKAMDCLQKLYNHYYGPVPTP